LFLINTKKDLPNPKAEEFTKFMSIRKRRSYLETIASLNTRLLWPDISVSYSQKVFEVHDFYLRLLPNYVVKYIGIPTYDYLAGLRANTLLSRSIILIDQGLSNRNFFGWNSENFEELLTNLIKISSTKGFTLYIKPHPTHLQFRKNYSKLLHNKTQIIDDAQLESVIAKTPIIIGFFSTLLLPLAALPHTTLITLENHPAGKLDVSKSFIDAGVAHPVYSLEELPWALEHIELLHQQQLPNKKKFEEEWLYKFDGKAGERLRDILLSDEL
ncbi:MAG TPA: polysialyltransferase family glycosyltransferase, partial [Pontibacter sp.]